MAEPARYHSCKSLAALWDVNPRTVWSLVNDGKLDCVRIGGVIRIRPQDIEKYEQRDRVCPDRSLSNQSPPLSESREVSNGMSGGQRVVLLNAFQLGQQIAQQQKECLPTSPRA